MNAMFEKIAPCHIESEQSVIGILLSHPERFDDLAELLEHVDFYDHSHGVIFSKIAEMINAGTSVDIITVAERLGEKQLESVGGLQYLVQLVQNVPSKSGLKKYAEIVKEKSRLRKLAALFNDGAEACLASQPRTSGEIASEAELELMRTADASLTEPKALSNILTEALEFIERRGTVSGLQTGFIDLDTMTGGFEQGDLIILAARPSMGKTAFAVNIIDNVVKDGKSVAFFSLEMSSQQIGLRILAGRSRIPMAAMRGGATLSDDHYNSMSFAMSKSSEQKLMVDDKPSVGVAYIRAKSRQIKRTHGLDLIVVDYLQLMTGKGDNRVQEIGSITRGLKALAKEIGVPIIALAQLNRGLEQRGDKRPILSDLRDSGEIEQDADIVLMLHREEYYNEDTDYKGIAECLIRKQRNGALGDVLLTFLGDIMRFESYGGLRPQAKPKQVGRKAFEYQ